MTLVIAFRVQEYVRHYFSVNTTLERLVGTYRKEVIAVECILGT